MWLGKGHVNVVTRIVLQIIKSSIHMIAQARRCDGYPKPFGSGIIYGYIVIYRALHDPCAMSHVLIFSSYPKSEAGTGFGWLRLKVGNTAHKAKGEAQKIEKKRKINKHLYRKAEFGRLKTETAAETKIKWQERERRKFSIFFSLVSAVCFCSFLWQLAFPPPRPALLPASNWTSLMQLVHTK